MEFHIIADWVENLDFDAGVGEHTVRMSGSAGEASNGPSPKRLVLAGLIGCTGMDVADLLRKMRVNYSKLRIEGTAPLTEEHPKTFARIDLKYMVTGKDIKRSKVEKAVDLSQEKYCGVSAMLRDHCPIAWEIEILEE